MIGNPKWFERRKYGGWGIRPVTWQGWLYIALMIIPYLTLISLPFWTETQRITITVTWLIILLIDTVHIMVNLKKDEREHKIEAIAERNAAWVMVLIIVSGILYQVITSGLQQQLTVDWFLITALLGALIAKASTNLILERRGV